MIWSGVVVCCCTDTTDDCVAFVRDWCKGKGYTPDDVRIVKRDGMVIAESKRVLKNLRLVSNDAKSNDTLPKDF